MRKNNNSYDLTRPCPYCGKTESLDFATLVDIHKVICNMARGGCGANTPWQDTKEKAADYWNNYMDDSDEK